MERNELDPRRTGDLSSAQRLFTLDGTVGLLLTGVAGLDGILVLLVMLDGFVQVLFLALLLMRSTVLGDDFLAFVEFFSLDR